MNEKNVAFIAFEEQDNLGIGYLASVLIQEGFQIRIIDFRVGPEAILETLLRFDPVVVGISVIFQHYIDDFRDLIHFLRKNNISCHFTAGGHYPSLRYKELLDLIPELDSVVLFEGEVTFLELVRALAIGQDLKNILGIAYRENSCTHVTGLRPLERDLDQFPPPLRLPLRDYAFGKKFATLLAGRGCVYNCTFCSIREFYSLPPGPIKRVRQPEMVVREMELLYEQGCRIYMFQDDDFPITYKKETWLNAYLKHLEDGGLNEKVLWKINCRPDEVSSDIFAYMQAHGLFLVYLGIESGTNEGLTLMNKHTTVETNLRAAQTLKNLGMVFDYGFMLFDPSSTFESVGRNLDFLEVLCGDGSSPITFCKMLPYAGTRIEQQLIREGRLYGRPGREEYNFLDPNLDRLYILMVKCFADWIGDHDGLLNLARWVRYFLAVFHKYFAVSSEFTCLEEAARQIIADSNRSFIHFAREILAHYQSANSDTCPDWASEMQKKVRECHQQYRKTLHQVIAAIEAMETAGESKEGNDYD